MDTVVAMLLGMGIGMVIQVVLGLALAPLLGMFETMIPAMLIGIYGGMLFGMRDSMNAGSGTLAAALGVGALFGALVVFGVRVYERALRGAVVDTGDGWDVTPLDLATQHKWDTASRAFDLLSFADDRRLGPHKRRLFTKIRGTTLMVAAGTGNDF